MDTDSCVFCKILAGELPAKVVYRDEDLMAFMDINAVSPGHVLVIPASHHRDMASAPAEVLQKLVVRAQAIGKLEMERLGASGFNLVCANGRDAQQSVFHLHFHVVPRYPDDGINLWFHGRKGQEEQAAAWEKLVG